MTRPYTGKPGQYQSSSGRLWRMKSQLEIAWATELDRLGLKWRYEATLLGGFYEDQDGEDWGKNEWDQWVRGHRWPQYLVDFTIMSRQGPVLLEIKPEFWLRERPDRRWPNQPDFFVAFGPPDSYVLGWGWPHFATPAHIVECVCCDEILFRPTEVGWCRDRRWYSTKKTSARSPFTQVS